MYETQLLEAEECLPAGFASRPASMQDAQAVTDLLNAEALEVSGEQPFSYTECVQEWQTPGFHVETAGRVVEAADGRMAGYIEVWDHEAVPAIIFLFGATHPDFYSQGVGTYLMQWAEQRARQALPRVPAEKRVSILAAAVNAYERRCRLFGGMDMQLTRVFRRMIIDLDQPIPEPQLPPDITIATAATFTDMRAIYRAYDESFEDHWGHVAQPEEEGLAQLIHDTEDPDFDPTLWYVALDGDEVAAFCLCVPKSHENPEVGNVNKLGVRRPWRRSGLGLAILHHAFRDFQQRGRFKQVALGVDADSLTGATRLYERAGMRTDRKNSVYEKVLRDGESWRN